jgi:hypothetical protein
MIKYLKFLPTKFFAVLAFGLLAFTPSENPQTIHELVEAITDAVKYMDEERFAKLIIQPAEIDEKVETFNISYEVKSQIKQGFREELIENGAILQMKEDFRKMNEHINKKKWRPRMQMFNYKWKQEETGIEGFFITNLQMEFLLADKVKKKLEMKVMEGPNGFRILSDLGGSMVP